MGRSGYDMTGFYQGGSYNPKNQLTQQKPTSNSPTMPKKSSTPSKKAQKAPAQSSRRSSPAASSSASASGSGRASQPQPPATDQGSHRFNPLGRTGRPTRDTLKPENLSGPRPGNLFGSALPPRKASSSTNQPSRPSAPRPAVQNTPSPPPSTTGKGSHRFNPFARPNPRPDNPSGSRPSNPFSSARSPPPPTFNRPSVPSTPPRSVLPPTTRPGDLWESAQKLSLAPSTPPRPVQPPPAVAAPGPVAPPVAIPRHLGGSGRAPQPVQQPPVQQPPTSVPRNLWEFRTRPVQQQPPSGSSSTSPPRGREVAAPGPSTPTPAPARVPLVGDPASDLGPQGFSLHRVVRVRSPSPGTASRLPTHTFDWVCCFCHRNNNEAQHPKQYTNPACLHVRVIDNREGAEQGRRTTNNMIYTHSTRTPGVEVCPDCSYIAYTWMDGRRQPVPIQNPLGMPPRSGGSGSGR